MIRINRSLNDYRHLKMVNNSLKEELEVLDSLCTYWEKVATNTNNLYIIGEQQSSHLESLNRSLQDTLEREKIKSRRVIIGVGVGATLFGIILGVLLN